MAEFNEFFVQGMALLGAGIAMIAGLGPGTVSYTHLDVYKRQRQYRSPKNL